MKKRLAASILAGAMIFNLAACGSSESTTPTTTVAETVTSAEKTIHLKPQKLLQILTKRQN